MMAALLEGLPGRWKGPRPGIPMGLTTARRTERRGAGQERGVGFYERGRWGGPRATPGEGTGGASHPLRGGGGGGEGGRGTGPWGSPVPDPAGRDGSGV